MAKASDPDMAALFVRLPVEQAEKLDRAAFELRVPKQQLVNALVERYVDPVSLARLPGLRGEGRRRVVVESEFDDMTVGSHSFRPFEPAEVLSPPEVAELLQVEESVVEELAVSGELPARKIGDEWRFSRTAVLDWLAAAADQPPEES
jgi:excisionase family DNA binding protein